MTTRVLAFLNTPELKDMQEKAATCDALSRDYDFDMREIQKWKENSDKWDAMNGTRRGISPLPFPWE